MYSRIYVEITNICNMNCSFCHGHSRAPQRMSREEFSSVLEKVQGLTRYIYFHLMGEPLLHPDLPLFIRQSKEKGLLPVITTNGTLLKNRKEEIIASGVHKVSVSLHSFEGGDKRAHEKYLEDVADFVEEASASGIIVVLRLWNRGADDSLNGDVLDFLRSRIGGEWGENTKGIRIHDKLHIEWGDRFEWPDKDLSAGDDNVFCYGLRDHFGILCDGTVVPCCLDSDGIINLGNIFENDIESILSSPRAQKIKEGFACRKANEALCKKCGYARRFK